MTEISLDGGPIFVDVATDPQFPILYTQLMESHDQNTQAAAEPAAKPSADDARNQETVDLANVKECQNKQQSEATNACIKIEKRRVKCPECKRFSSETEEKMLRHIRKVHRGENPFQCYMCEYSTYNKAVFEEHVRVHQGIKPYKCSFCDYRSASKKNAKKHELIHRKDNPLRCHECDFIAKNSQSFCYHKKNVHGIIKVDDKKVDQQCECEICKRTFSDRKKKYYHYKQRQKCAECAYVTCSKMLFQSHLEFDHGIKVKSIQDTKLFTCALCPWTSNSKPRILLHLIHHPNQKVNEDVIDITVLRKSGIME